ncbi:amino acid synthesis family protein [Hespellia stercorisuis]|uniref:Amino acid synthesis n=1 Tax=Hespellia stercorisuis DSM 15480 TaxID=1121950 RepID=A0A1M6SLV0_9FIRM|nr:amino acid synthesis family protein [Hespellia stercorisuis]SHK45731.1 Amino acid synthesis [Hespellia stercorisuis DSM 15480]
MENLSIRKIVTNVEETYFEGFTKLDTPIKKCSVAAVIKNPFAGSYVEDLSALTDIGEYLGGYLTRLAVEAMNIAPSDANSYGKGAIIGLNGELEHGAAILHPKLGKPMREQVNGGKAIIPSAKKAGPAGTSLDVPLHYKDAAFVRTHYDAMEVRIPDAPKADEIVVAIVVTNGGRPHPRIGGLQVSEIKGEDGLR